MLLLLTLVGPASHVVCMHPTYQQLYAMPAGLGARVSLWTSEPGAALDEANLEALLKPDTSLVILNNPQNPTGRILSTEQLRRIVRAVKTTCNGAVILCDEVYRPLFHSLPSGSAPPASIVEAAQAENYTHIVASGSLSKAYSCVVASAAQVRFLAPLLMLMLLVAQTRRPAHRLASDARRRAHGEPQGEARLHDHLGERARRPPSVARPGA